MQLFPHDSKDLISGNKPMNEENYFKLLENEIARLNRELEIERSGLLSITGPDDAENADLVWLDWLKNHTVLWKFSSRITGS